MKKNEIKKPVTESKKDKKVQLLAADLLKVVCGGDFSDARLQ